MTQTGSTRRGRMNTHRKEHIRVWLDMAEREGIGDDQPNPYRAPEWNPDLLRVKLRHLLKEYGEEKNRRNLTGWERIADGYALALDFLAEHDLLPEFVAYVERQESQ